MCASNLNTDAHAVLTSEDCSFLLEIPSPNKRGTPTVLLHPRASAAWRNSHFHGVGTGNEKNPIFILLLSLKVLQLQDGAWTLGTPGNSLSLQPTASSHFPGAQECWEQRLAHRKPSCLQIQSCALTPANRGIWEGFIITCIVYFYIIQLQKSYICLGCSSTTLSEYQVCYIASSSKVLSLNICINIYKLVFLCKILMLEIKFYN